MDRLDVGCVDSGSDAVNLHSRRGGKEDDVGFLPAWFQAPSLMSADSNGVPDLKDMGNNRLVCLFSIGSGQRLPDFLLDDLEGL